MADGKTQAGASGPTALFANRSTGNYVLDFVVVAVAVTFLMALLNKIFRYLKNRGGRRARTCNCSYD